MDRLLLSPVEAAAALGLSRAKLYQLMAAGEIENVKLGRSRKIPRDALDTFIENLHRQQKRANKRPKTAVPETH